MGGYVDACKGTYRGIQGYQGLCHIKVYKDIRASAI